MKKKTFIEFLKEQDNDEMLYIGMKNGNSFVYIETAEKVLENLDKLEKYLKDKSEAALKLAEYKIEVLPSEIIATRKKIGKAKSKDELNSLKSKLSDKEDAFASAIGSRRKYSRILFEWVKLPDREVVDVYKHESDIPGTTIILKGYDIGELWFKDEKKII